MRGGWFLAGWLALAGSTWAEPATGSITVDVANLRAERGWEICALFASSDGFPLELAKAVQHSQVAIHDGQATCVFDHVAPGSYAVAVMRDEKGTGVPEPELFGMPRGGVGASNDAKGFITPPRFDDARFDFKAGALRLSIKMTYRAPR